jgi:fatty acid/phospholipid biosynthesis enzyme
MKKINITIDADGNVSLDTNGFEGNVCLKETEKLEKELGMVEKREKKPSFYARITKKNQVRSSR